MQRLTITTIPPSSIIHPKRPQRQYTIRTISRTTDLDTLITFSTDSVQHQMIIPTLTTRIPLIIALINALHMVWDIVRHP